MEFAGSAVGIVSLGLTVLQGLINYYSAWKDCPKDVANTLATMENLRDIFSRVEALEKDKDLDPALIAQLKSSTERCESRMADLKKELEKIKEYKTSNGGKERMKAVFERALYPFKEDTLEKLRKTVLEVRDIVSLTLQTLNLRKADAWLNVAYSDVSTKSYRLGKEAREEERFKEIRRWLNPIDPYLNHNAACGKRQEATGNWFVEGDQFREWQKSPSSFLWLHGKPGCGKTVISSTIIESTKTAHPEATVALFYFDFQDIEKQKSDQLLRSLVMQLASRNAVVPQSLYELYCGHGRGLYAPSAEKLADTIKDIVQTLPESYIIIDALDECGDQDALFKFLRALSTWQIGTLHLLVTSRKEVDIEDCLNALVKGEDQICIQSALVNQDIRAYIRETLQTDEKLNGRWGKKPEALKLIDEKLMEKADGMFRWVFCQLESLRSCLTFKKLEKALESLPKTLNETYARILHKIDEEYSEMALKILQWLIFSKRPLKIRQIVEVIAIDVHATPRFDIDERLADPRDILRICSSLVVTVSGAGADAASATWQPSDKIRLAHFSVKEYLISERIQIGPEVKWFIQKINSNISIAETCLAYLLGFEGSEFWERHTTDDFPLAGYAAEFWFLHAQVAENETEPRDEETRMLRKMIMEFFLENQDGYNRMIPHPLLYASATGFVNSASLLLRAGADVNAEAPHGSRYDNALQAASSKGHDRVVRCLLRAGADVGAGGPWASRYGNALQAASSNDHDQVVNCLLQTGANLNTQGGECGNALQAASARGHVSTVQLLLQAGADVNTKGGKYGNALHAASYESQDSTVKLLLRAGADVNAQGGRYGNALQAASQRGRDSTVQLLLQTGADVNAQGGEYGNALQAASYESQDSTVKLLLRAGADVNAQGGRYGNALQAASQRGRDSTVQLLLQTGADVNAQGGHYGNALQAASFVGHDRTVEFLLQTGADVNAQGEKYGNALLAASFMGHDSTVQLLLQAGADVTAQGGEYDNALQTASVRGHDRTVELLLQARADVNAQGGKYGNALQAASCRGNDSTVQLLLEAGADVNAQEGKYGNALQAASSSWRSHDSTVQLLLQAGADVNAQGGHYGNALQAASVRGHDRTVELLLQAGAIRHES